MTSVDEEMTFIDGALSVFRGAGFLAKTRTLWVLALVPTLVLVVVFVALAVAGVSSLVPMLLSGLQPESTLGRLGSGLLRFLVSVIVVLAAGLVAAWLAPALSGPALERIIIAREGALGLPERPTASFLRELWCGLRAQLLGLLVGGPVLVALWGLTIAVPPLAPFTFPAKLVVLSALVAWNLLDYPLSLRGYRLRERLALLGSASGAVFGFGAVVTLLFAIPLGPIVLLPAGVAGAAEIAARLERKRAATGDM